MWNILFSGGISLLILTFHSILLQREQIVDNYNVCVCHLYVWIMVHQVREDIMSKKRKEEAETELVFLGENALDGHTSWWSRRSNQHRLKISILSTKTYWLFQLKPKQFVLANDVQINQNWPIKPTSLHRVKEISHFTNIIEQFFILNATFPYFTILYRRFYLFHWTKTCCLLLLFGILIFPSSVINRILKNVKIQKIICISMV